MAKYIATYVFEAETDEIAMNAYGNALTQIKDGQDTSDSGPVSFKNAHVQRVDGEGMDTKLVILLKDKF